MSARKVAAERPGGFRDIEGMTPDDVVEVDTFEDEVMVECLDGASRGAIVALTPRQARSLGHTLLAAAMDAERKGGSR